MRARLSHDMRPWRHHIVLDRTDRAILEHLAHDARMTNRALAEQVGLSPSGCLDRVRRLEERGVLRGAHVHVDPAAVGIGVRALVQVRLRRHTRRDVSAFLDHAFEFPEVKDIFHVTGETDFVVQVGCRDMDHLRDFTLDAFTTRREVATLSTQVVFGTREKPTWVVNPR